jgi:hypothetical protein
MPSVTTTTVRRSKRPVRINRTARKRMRLTRRTPLVATRKGMSLARRHPMQLLRKRLNDPRVGGKFSTSTNRRNPSRIADTRRLTEHGWAFLRCAFAPPDFTSTRVTGVPDEFRGVTLLKKHRIIQSFTFTPGTDYYFVLMPVPGVAFFYTTTTAGSPVLYSNVFTGVPYTDSATLFGSGSLTNGVVNRFRYLSNHIEFINTTNLMSYSGNLSVFKIQPQLTIRPATLATNEFSISGLQAIASTNVDQYSGSFKDGAYTACYNMAPQFDFQDIINSQNPQMPSTVVDPPDFGQLATGLAAFTGLDNNFESVCIKVTGVTGNSESMLIKTWACVEYVPLATSVVYEYCGTSPAVDAYAMKMYREVILSLPIAVPSSENADFWKRVLAIIRTISGAGSALPGPYGAISGGVNAIATGISNMLM